MVQTALIIISILLIAVVLLQAGKAESASNALTGGNDSLFQKWQTSFEYMQQRALYQNVNIFKAENIFSLVWEDKIFQKLLCNIFFHLYFFHFSRVMFLPEAQLIKHDLFL